MSHAIIQLGLLLGFLATWVGFACLFLAVAWPNLSIRRIKENNSLPYAQRMKRVNDDLLRGLCSRLGRVGKILLAIGLSLLILVGFVWFVLQIVERQAASG